MNNLYDGYFDLKDYNASQQSNENNYDDYNNFFEIRTLSKTEFNRLLKTIKKTIKEAKKNKQ